MIQRAAFTTLAMLLGGALVFAQPVRREVLKDLSVTEMTPCQQILVDLQAPFTVEGFAPPNKGAFLLVRIVPLQSGEITAPTLPEHEALLPERSGETPLEEIVFENNGSGGPRLNFRFTHEVAYYVTSGSDFRSVSVTLHPDTLDAAACRQRSGPHEPTQ